MSRASRLLAILAAWVMPLVWIAAATISRPSDGTLVSPPTAGSSTSVPEVASTSGSTPLREGDRVRAVDGRSVGEQSLDLAEGRTLVYDVVRPGQEGDVALGLQLEVRLGSYPIWAALRGAGGLLAVMGLVLVAATVVLWRAPASAAARVGLVAAALLPCSLTAGALGPGVADLVSERGVWWATAGRVALVAALSAAVLVAAGLAGKLRAWTEWSPALLPPAAAAIVIATRPERPMDPVPLVAAGLTALAVSLVVLVRASRRATVRRDRLATRLAALGLVAGLTVRLALVEVPREVTGRALLPAGTVDVVLAVLVLACLVVAVLRLRVELVEPAVRRGLTQALVVAVVGGLALAGVGAVGLTTGSAVEPMLAGGVVALLVLPVVLVGQRAVRTALPGGRDLPRRVVAELRRLDPAAQPEETLEETLTLLARRLRLSFAAIESPVAGSVSVGEPRGDRVTVELVVGRTTLGVMHLEPDSERDPFAAADRRLLEDVGAQVGALVQAVALARELQQARHRLVAAREEERRRLRQDLHDGLGPSLATLVLRLETALDVVRDDPDAAAAMVAEIAERARADIDEVRRLVDGLRPAALDQLGLVSALRDRAVSPDLRRDGFGWTVTADPDVEPLPAAVEVAAYRIAMEAVSNAARHSGGSRCSVHLRRVDGRLELVVEDDGHGVAADAGWGVGMGSMRQRAQELGGTCDVVSDPTGTRVLARLPVDEAEAHR